MNTKFAKLNELRLLPHVDLIELFCILLRDEHYSRGKTPILISELYALDIRADDFRDALNWPFAHPSSKFDIRPRPLANESNHASTLPISMKQIEHAAVVDRPTHSIWHCSDLPPLY